MLGELQVQREVVTVTLHGDLDLVTIDELRGLLAVACADAPPKVVIDLSDVPFVDVLSLSTILATADALREQGARLTVYGATAPVRRICSLLNAEDVLMPALPLPRVSAN